MIKTRADFGADGGSNGIRWKFRQFPFIADRGLAPRAGVDRP
jgi:hypothetical protein